jgi:hypothetical protein
MTPKNRKRLLYLARRCDALAAWLRKRVAMGTPKRGPRKVKTLETQA